MKITISTILLSLAILRISSAEPQIKNVLFIVSDDLKASALGAYGNTICKTPNLDKLAERGMVFNRAYCQGLWCAPSRQSFMFSRYKDNAGINMGEHFKNSGWYSARVGKIYHMRVPGDIIDGTDGLDVPSSWTEKFNTQGKEAHTPGDYECLNKNIFTTELEGRESTRMKNRMFVNVSYEGDGSDQPDYKCADKAIELLRQKKDKPFFLAVGMVRPHYPHVAPKQYFDMYPYQDMPLPKVPEGDVDDIPPPGRSGSTNKGTGIGQYPDNIKRMWSGYYASVTFMDEQVGRILDELDKLNLRDSTAIVFTSDHGYHLGEHTFWQKGVLHEEVTRVPLIVSAPGMTSGNTDAITELMDIYPSLAELAGLDIPENVQGKSFVAVLKDAKAEIRPDSLSIKSRSGYGLRGDRFAYMRYGKGKNGEAQEELYDMVKDPDQFTNQARNPEYSKALDDMRGRMDARLKEANLSSSEPAKKKK